VVCVRVEKGSEIAGPLQHRRHRHYRIVPAFQMRVDARPGPVGRPLDKAGANRIERDMADGMDEMLLVQCKRCETPLPQIEIRDRRHPSISLDPGLNSRLKAGTKTALVGNAKEASRFFLVSGQPQTLRPYST